MAHVCDYFYLIRKMKVNLNFANNSIYKTIVELAPKLDQVFDECRWLGKTVECGKIFTPVITKLGYCFAFNSINVQDMYTDR